MSRKRNFMTSLFTTFSLGRILLHVGCLLRGDHHWAFHFTGIRREFCVQIGNRKSSI